MNIATFISKRLKASDGRQSSRVGASIAVIGVACTIIVMELTLAIVVGFKSQIKEKLSGFNSQITVGTPYSYSAGRTLRFITLDQATDSIINEELPDVRRSLTISQPSIIKTDEDFATVIIKGFDRGHDWSFEKGNITQGTLPDFTAESSDTLVVISERIARDMQLKLHDRITCCFFIDNNIKLRRYNIAALYRSDFGDYDNSVIYGSLSGLQHLNSIDSNSGTALEFNGLEKDSIPAIADRLQKRFIDYANKNGLREIPVVDNITRTGATILNWLELLDTNVIVIFSIMCCVAALTLISSLFIIILDKVQTIGILRSLGCTRRQVRSIFVIITLKLVGRGMIIGNIIAIAVILIQQYYKIIPLDPEMYYLSAVPSEFNLFGIVAVNIGVAVFSWLILIMPARLASSISPAKTMRYE